MTNKLVRTAERGDVVREIVEAENHGILSSSKTVYQQIESLQYKLLYIANYVIELGSNCMHKTAIFGLKENQRVDICHSPSHVQSVSEVHVTSLKDKNIRQKFQNCADYECKSRSPVSDQTP